MQQVLSLWPKLQGLDMPTSGLALDKTEMLSEMGKTLPHLTRLDLSFEHSGQFVHELSRCHWSGLQELNVENNQCESDMIGLLRNQWPLLETVNLASNMLGADEVLLLKQFRWPLLRDLDLTENYLDAQAMRHLQEGPWPLLQKLDLSSCLFSTAAASERKAYVEALSTCKMPCLTYLGLACNDLTDVSLIKTLVLGDWPCLHHLNLAGNFGSHVCIVLFGVDHHKVLQQKVYKFRHRFADRFAAGRWPVLDMIDLRDL